MTEDEPSMTDAVQNLIDDLRDNDTWRVEDYDFEAGMYKNLTLNIEVEYIPPGTGEFEVVGENAEHSNTVQ